MADRDLEGVFELFSVPIGGRRNAVRLNEPMAALAVADVVALQVSPDSERCFFTVRAETCDCDDSGSFELHSAGIAPLSTATRIADEIGQVQVSADGAWIVFQERLDDGEDFGRLYSAPVGGALEPLELAAEVGAFVITQDGSAVVFSRDDPPRGVYRRPIDGSAPASLLASGAVERLLLSPDGSRVVYQRYSAAAFELFSVPADGSGTPVQLNDLASPRGDRRYPFAITPDGERVYFWTDQEVNEVVELFSVPIDGGASPTKLSGTLVPGGDVVFHAGIAASADGSRLVYQADALVDGLTELFSAPIDGSAPPVRLNAPLPAGGAIVEFAVAGSSRVVYRADQAADEIYELFSVPIDAATPPVRLNAPLVTGGDVSHYRGPFRRAFTLGPDGEALAYLADQATDETFELFMVPVDGSAAPRRLGGPSVSGGDVLECFQITRDGKSVLYLADHDVDEVAELFVASLDGGRGRKVNAPLVAGGDVAWSPAPALTPDGRWILYAADQDTDTVQELYRIRSRAP